MEKVTTAGVIIPEKIISVPKDLRTLLSSPDWNIIEKRTTAILDCSTLQFIERDSIYRCQTMEHLLKQFPFHSRAAVYSFKVLSDHSCEDILHAIRHAKSTVQRTFPYIPEICRQSPYLYNGEVKCDIRGRIIAHCGEASRPESHGLQLCHWAHLLGLIVQIDCFILKPGATDKRLLLEREMRKALQPLLGKF